MLQIGVQTLNVRHGNFNLLAAHAQLETLAMEELRTHACIPGRDKIDKGLMVRKSNGMYKKS